MLVVVLLLVLLVVPAAASAEVKQRNTDGISIIDADVNGSGPGVPYPSPIVVSGFAGTITDVNVTLDEITHDNPVDMDIVLIAPNGDRVLLMSDVGGTSVPSSTNDLTFDDEASGTMSLTTFESGTFKPTNGATGTETPFPPGGPQSLNFISTSLSTFDGDNPNGTWNLYVRDENDNGAPGQIQGGWSIEIETNAGFTFPTPNVGPVSVYPSSVAVSGLTGVVTDVNVRVNRLIHHFPDDIDMLLVGPGGAKSLLMSDAGGIIATGADDVTLTFDDEAGSALSDAGPSIAEGSYRPTDFRPGESLPGAPAGPYPAALSAFDGQAPNGTWSLYVYDDEAGGATGDRVAAGWSLELTTGPPSTGGGPGGGGPGGGGGGPSGPGGVADTTKPRLFGFGLDRSAFPAAPSGGSVRATARRRTRTYGARVTYRLSEAARTTFTVQKKATGRRAGRRCVPRTRANRARPSCTRWIRKGAFSRNGQAGRNRFRFTGRLGGRKLPLGRYRFEARARDAAGNTSAVSRVAFRIVS